MQKEITLDLSEIKKRSRQSPVVLAIIGSIASICSLMGIGNGFGINPSMPFVMVAAIAVSLIVQLFLANKTIMKIGIPVIIVALAATVGATLIWTVNGMLGILNQFITYTNESMDRANLKYVVEDKTLNRDMFITTIVLSVLISVVINVLIRFRRIFAVTCIIVVCVMANVLYKGEAQTEWIVMGLVSVYLLFYYSNIRVKRIPKSNISAGLIATIIAVASVVFVLFVNYAGINSIDDLKDAIVYNGEKIIYGKNDYPEGRFYRFDKVTTGDEDVRLTVTMSDPKAMHLKGYVGCQYTPRGWDKNKENAYGGEYKGVIDWFRTMGYYPLTQTAFYIGYSVQNDGISPDDITEGIVQIKCNTASKKYQYVPENLKTMSALVSPKQDVNFVAQSIFVDDEYAYDVVNYKDDKYLEIPAQDWYRKGSSNTEFIQAEMVYHAFAEENYLSVPEEEEKILEEYIPKCSNNIPDAINTVRHYLGNTLEYSMDCAPFDSDKNYLYQTLIEEKRGYSVHFATIATLMFRHYGIPARYVEGYYIPNVAHEKTVEVMDSNAHAWVEIYVEGMGFIPIEVTPGYYDEDNLGGSTTDETPQDQSLNGGGGSNNDKDDKEDKEQSINWLRVLCIVLIIIATLVIITVFVLIIRRMIIVSKRKRMLASKDNNEVMAVASRYVDDMCKYTNRGFKENLPDDICDLLLKYKFSKYPIYSDDVKKMTEYMNKTILEIWKEQSFFKKIKLRFWNALK